MVSGPGVILAPVVSASARWPSLMACTMAGPQGSVPPVSVVPSRHTKSSSSPATPTALLPASATCGQERGVVTCGGGHTRARVKLGREVADVRRRQTPLGFLEIVPFMRKGPYPGSDWCLEVS